MRKEGVARGEVREEGEARRGGRYIMNIHSTHSRHHHIHTLTMTNEGLGPQVKPVQCCHMQWGPAIQVLDVGVRPCLDEQLHTQGSVVGEGCIVQWCLSLVVEAIETDVVLEEDVHDSVLPVVTCHVEGSAPVCVHSVRL